MPELAEVFLRYGPAYVAKFGDRMPQHQRRAMQAIQDCRTPRMGGEVYLCPACGEHHYSYHSCKNRHCPKCQNHETRHWLEQQRARLLPVPYFLVTVTVPEGLRPLARSRPRTAYPILFRASADALKTLALDPKHLGGQIGMLGVLQTWTRDLIYHPHIHYVVPGGALSPAGTAWIPSQPDFLVPVRALSVIFRAKVRDALRKTGLYESVPAQVWRRPWVVHCEPAGRGEEVLKYLAPYVLRVAICNNRILDIDNGQVTFSYKDSETGETKTRTLDAEEFIRRFLQHVLPAGFVKIRYYGFLAPSNRHKLQKIRSLLAAPDPAPAQPETTACADPSDAAASEPTPPRCPRCGVAMVLVERFRRSPRGAYGNTRSPP